MQWRPEEIQAFREVLPYVRTFREAATVLTKRLNRPITMTALHNLSQRLGMTRGSSTLGTLIRDTVPPPGPPPPRVPDIHIPITWDDGEEEPTNPKIEERYGYSVSDTDMSPPPVEPPSEPSIPPDETGLAAHRLREQLRQANLAKKKLLDELKSRDVQIEILGCLRSTPPSPIVARRGVGDGKRRQGTPVLVLSDLHIEEPVSLASVNGLNEYSLDIAAKCIDRCADAFEWLSHDPRYDCREAVIAILGDTYSGYIHDELKESNFLSPVQAVVWLQEHIERMIQKILATTSFERITVVCVDGNHGRLTNKIRVQTRTENSLEWLFYKTLAARFAHEPRLAFSIADGEWVFTEVYGTTIGFTHGDSFRYQGGVGGLLIPLRRGFNEMRKYRKVDMMVCGHFHQRTDTGEILVNGSMIGVNAYSMHLHASPEPRQQSWFMVDSTRGKALSAPVWL